MTQGGIVLTYRLECRGEIKHKAMADMVALALEGDDNLPEPVRGVIQFEMIMRAKSDEEMKSLVEEALDPESEILADYKTLTITVSEVQPTWTGTTMGEPDYVPKRQVYILNIVGEDLQK